MRAPSKKIVIPGCLLKMGVDRERAAAAENKVFTASSVKLFPAPHTATSLETFSKEK